MQVALSVALLTLCIGAAHADSGQVSPVATVKFVFGKLQIRRSKT